MPLIFITFLKFGFVCTAKGVVFLNIRIKDYEIFSIFLNFIIVEGKSVTAMKTTVSLQVLSVIQCLCCMSWWGKKYR